MASPNNNNNKNPKNNQLVSTMIKQGFISNPYLSPSPPHTQIPTRPDNNPSPTRPGNPSPSPTPTLFDMMSEEQNQNSFKVQHDRVFKVLADAPFPAVGDVRLTIAARDGFKVSMDVHRRVLVGKSRFFAEKLKGRNGLQHSVEILDCDDVEVYVETLVLMYCDDLKKRLIGEDVTKVLGLLKISSAIMFDDGVLACLEYLEAVPWSQQEEEKVVSHLSQLQLPDSAADILQRLVAEPSTSSRSDDILQRLLTAVLHAKDDKARKEMKKVISRLLRENTSNSSSHESNLDISKDTLYHFCHRCLTSLILSLSEATSVDDNRQDRGILMGEIAREADNLQWIVDILIDRKMGDAFVKLWAEQKELSVLHSKIPTMYRHEISKITAQLCVAIGRGILLVPKDVRYCLLSTWLESLYEDFGWMKRAGRSIDKKLVEEGLGQTILTLPLAQQQTILLNWFDRFLNKGDDCPNIQRAFEVWWRRSFVKQYTVDSQLQLALFDYTE
ncbi:BTB/POZ domain-containing protein [Capsicum annuum]|uniref:BTB/POZ domain-containing protein At5g60050 n=1 Tax=Capsicum annuum TaxID=4072 RepID=UPI0007BF812E|nr:BTB/POZ domain-containing protein At5g60050 [Capsicum annuum]KAF3663734.1 BTB/POZ domain-containing protein [Capsicum annuum]KAF3666675.1 BTB/POZ domain-containing protein [Capsicum annuum]